MKALLNSKKYAIKLIFTTTVLLIVLSEGCTLNQRHKIKIAMPSNLTTFELPPIEGFNQEDQRALDRANEKESPEDLAKDYAETPEIKPLKKEGISFISGDKIHVDIYVNSKVLGKQAAVVKVNDVIKYVFATSTGTKKKPTPTVNNVFAIKQKFRHMSNTYPGTTNNMDFVTYFYPAVGFHSTTFGNYPKLGKADSHGCVRLGKPEARILYRLIKEAGKENTTVSVIKNSDPQESEDVINLIKVLLSKDLNFISYMITNLNSGDVAGLDEDTYFEKFLELQDNSEKENLILKAVTYYNTKTLLRENEEIDRFNEQAKKDSEATGIPPLIIRPHKSHLEAVFPILEMNHWANVDLISTHPDYPERIYPKF